MTGRVGARQRVVTTILVAEDDGALREFVSRALLKNGHDVTAVADGAQALDALRTGKYDMVVADIAMPGIDGVTLAREIAKQHADLPILLMTGYASERECAQSLDAPVHDIIAKPFTMQQISGVTADILAQTRRERRIRR
jgi:DNA-binding response OmpR family regulator